MAFDASFLVRAASWTAGGVVLALVVVAGACRAPSPSQAAAARDTPPRVTVQGAQGPLAADAAARTLAALSAEGQRELLDHHLQVLAAQGDVALVRDNSARLLVDGPATFAAMKSAIAAARSRILLQSYIFEDRGLAAEVASWLLRRAADGVQVALLYDSVGSLGTDEAFFDALRAGGVAVCAFNPINPGTRPGYWGIHRRDHRKLLVVDNDRAFTGGINISRVYGSGSFGRHRNTADDASADNRQRLEEGWRDTQIELAGPVVPVLANEFNRAWLDQGCIGALPLPGTRRVAAAGQRVVKVIASDPREPDNRIYTSLLEAVNASRRSVHLTMAYFAPGEVFVQALCDAARRGVDVQMVLPGRSDFALVLHAGRSYYSQLLAAGVGIHEMEHALMHAKTAVIDGVLSTVGSSNLDWRSLVANHELNVLVLGEDFGAQMEAMFARDRASSRTIDADAWERRSLSHRMNEALGRVAERWL